MFKPKDKIRVLHKGKFFDGVVLFSEDKNQHLMIKIEYPANTKRYKVWYVHKTRLSYNPRNTLIPVVEPSYSLSDFVTLLEKYLSRSQAKDLAMDLLRKHVEYINR